MSREPCDLRARWLGGPTWCHTHDLPADHAASISMDEIGHDGSDTPVDGFGMTGERQSAETALSAAGRLLETYIIRAGDPSLGPTWQEAMAARDTLLDAARAALPASTESGSRLDVERLEQAVETVSLTPVRLPDEDEDSLSEVEWMAKAIAAEYARLAPADAIEPERPA